MELYVGGLKANKNIIQTKILTWDDPDPGTGLRGWIYKWSRMERLPLALPGFQYKTML